MLTASWGTVMVWWLLSGCWPWIDAPRPGAETDLSVETGPPVDDPSDLAPALRLIVVAVREAPPESSSGTHQVLAYVTGDPDWRWWHAWSPPGAVCTGERRYLSSVDEAISESVLGEQLLERPSCATLVRSDTPAESCLEASELAGAFPMNNVGEGAPYLFAGFRHVLEVGMSYDLMLGPWPSLGEAEDVRVPNVIFGSATGRLRFRDVEFSDVSCYDEREDLSELVAPYESAWFAGDGTSHVVWDVYPERESSGNYEAFGSCATPDSGSAILFDGQGFGPYKNDWWSSGDVLCLSAARGEVSQPPPVTIGDWEVSVEGVFLNVRRERYLWGGP